MDRRGLLRQGNEAAVDLRDTLDLDPFGPADPYEAAARLNVKVLFLDASMEGFYFQGPPARILLSNQRPVGRRAFTCAHELGHHLFGHGSTIDELKADEDLSDFDKPEEVLVNAFAAFFLMPSAGLRGAFNRRGWSPETAEPWQVYLIACEFGVGYATLVTHLGYTLRDISEAKRETLASWTPQKLRKQLGVAGYKSLVLADGRNEAPTMDIEKEGAVLLPSHTVPSGDVLAFQESLPGFDLYRAARRGHAQIAGLNAGFSIRVMPEKYIGPAANRFLEDPDEDED